MKVICPESSCRMQNEALANECVRCGTPLQSYIQLLNHPAQLFNQGLANARNGAFEQARDLFAAIVYWCPKDLEARNALAMACLSLHDLLEARRQWKLVLEQAPADPVALRGLSQIEAQIQPSATQATSAAIRTQQKSKHPIKTLLTRKRKPL